MNKTIIININSIVFHIEEDAYETLRSYMIEIKRHFSQTPDSEEILQDIENRIAEMFSEHIQAGKKEVISRADVDAVIAQMGKVSDFENVEDVSEEPGQPHFGQQQNEQQQKDERQKEDRYTFATEKKMMRNPDDTVIGGVCSGLGYYFGIETKWIRVLFVLFFLFGGSGVLLYVVLWAIMPKASSRAERMAMRGEEPNLQNFKKSFEDEMGSYGQEFTQAKSFVSRGAHAVGNGFLSIFGVFGKFLALIMLITCGTTILGLLFCLVAFSLGVFGYQDTIVFPPLESLGREHQFFALLAGVMAILIPFIALFNLFLRILLKTNPMNNYMSLSLWATWAISIVAVISYSVIGARDVKEFSTIRVEKPLEEEEVYYFGEKDFRVINASTSENGQKKFKVDANERRLSKLMRSEISIQFEQIDSLEKPFIQYNYMAKGKTDRVAAERASRINYEIHEEKGKFYFDSHFLVNQNEPYREQEVSVVVFLPVGSKVVLSEDLQWKLRNISYGTCQNEYADDTNIKETEWTMKRSGLVCAVTKSQHKKKKNRDNEEINPTDATLEEVSSLEE